MKWRNSGASTTTRFSCVWGYVLQQYVPVRTFIMGSYDQVAGNTYKFSGNIPCPRPARLGPSPRLATTTLQIHTVVAPSWARHLSFPTEISPLEQVMTQVPPQLPSKLLASSPAPRFLSRPDLPAAVHLNLKPATSRLTRKVERGAVDARIMACYTQSLTVDLMDMSGELFSA